MRQRAPLRWPDPALRFGILEGAWHGKRSKPERLELIERFYRAFNARDLDAMLKPLASDMEWHPNPEEPEQGVARSHEELIAGVRDRWEALDRLHTEIEDVQTADDELLAVVRHEAVLRGSDAVIERREVHLWSFSGDAISKLQEFPTREAALEAARGQ